MDIFMYVLMNIWCALSRYHIALVPLRLHNRIYIYLFAYSTIYILYMHTSKYTLLYTYTS